MHAQGRLRAVIERLDERVDHTPPQRNRAADFLRVAAICVVVLWHWVFSITHRRGDQIVNPNPIEDVPGGWLLTWLLQVMPLFFVIGGYANLTGWDAVAGERRRSRTFLQRRTLRLVLPALVFMAVWTVIDVGLRLAVPGYAGTLSVAPLLFTPLWFLGAYLWVTMLVPLTARAHRRFGQAAVAALGAVVVALDAGRFGLGQEWLGYVNAAVVWVVVHQLGFLWRDGYLDTPRRRWVLAAGGYVVVALATLLPVYPRSMVAVPSEQISHMWPTTAVIAALAVAHTGVITLMWPLLDRWLQRRGPYRVVVFLGGLLLTIFLWHMTALLIVFLVVEALGFEPSAEPTAEWWMVRPFWLVAPAVVLAVLVAIFAPVEQRIRRALSLSQSP